MNSKKAFSLIELLTAISVLMLLIVMIGQIIGSSEKATNSASTKLDGLDHARFALDRFGIDWNARIRRSDVPFFFSKQTGNDLIEFYSEVSAYSGTRQVTLVAYRIPDSVGSNPFELERGISGTNWSGSPLLCFSPQLPSAISSSDYEVISESVFRLEFCYLLKSTGILTNTKPANTSDVAAVVVAMATIGPNGRKMLSGSQLQQLSDALPDCVEGSDPLSNWVTTINSATFASGIPRQCVQSVYVFQRYYYAN